MNQPTEAARFAGVAEALRRALEAKDPEAYIPLFAEDVVFFSPIEAAPMRGRDVLGMVLGAVFGLFEDFRYHDHAYGESGLHVLCFTARVGETAVEGVDLVRFNAAGRVGEFRVLLRPFAALELLHREMGARLGPPPG